MREVVCKSIKVCVKCDEPIGAGEKAIQSESFYGHFWHIDCAPRSVFIKWRD